MKRKKFIQTTLAASATTAAWLSSPILFGNSVLAQTPNPTLLNQKDNDKVLVLIQLNGGNDGLNSLVPLAEYDKLAKLRSNILIPEKELVPLRDDLAFHPSLSDLGGLYHEEKLGFIQNVAYPNQNRSHFRSLDIWNSASSSNEFLSTGWLGRYLNNYHPEFPISYPSDKHPHPLAISVGNTLAENCNGKSFNFGFTIENAEQFSDLNEPEFITKEPKAYYELLDFLQTNLRQTNLYGNAIKKVVKKGNNKAQYPEGNVLAQRLKTVARFISGGLRTQIYVITLPGFDTHAYQTDKDDPKLGVHASLLQTLSEAIKSFQEDLDLLGLEDRVMGMTYSEFGRQIRSNHSFGTDHGTAAPLFLFGKAIGQSVIGENPIIPDEVTPQEGLSMQFDFRDVYGSILIDWFNTSEKIVKNVLHNDFNYIPILLNENEANVAIRKKIEIASKINIDPSPFKSKCNISFESDGGRIGLFILNSKGGVIETLVNKKIAIGKHQITFKGNKLEKGNYYVHLVSKGKHLTQLLVKN